jgi:hypothetical protein
MAESIITLGIGATPVSITPFVTTGLFPASVVAPVPASSGGAIPLALQLYESPGGALIADLSDATDCVIDNGRHGFRSLTCFVPMPLELAFAIAEQGKAKWLSLNYGAGVVWEGRVEDPTVVIAEDGTGLQVTAFGAWRALFDVPYTALWSKSGTAGWRVVTGDDNSTFNPGKYEIDNNNRIYIAPRKNETFSSSGSQGVVGFTTPDNGGRQVVGVEFDYEVNGSSSWAFRLQRRDSDWVFDSSEWLLSGTGSVQSGSVHLAFSGIDNLMFMVFFNAASATYTGETGDTYLKITNLRNVTSTARRVNTALTANTSTGSQTVPVGTTAGMYVGQSLYIASGSSNRERVVVEAVNSSTTFTATFANAHTSTQFVQAHAIYADQIISDLVNHITAANPAQLSASTALIESPGLDLLDEVYEDAWPGDIATKLAGLGDNQDPPRLWEVGVWEGQKLHFRPKGSDSQIWAIDADELTVNSTLELLRNSVYASYQDANNRTLRTAVADDATSQAQYGIVRRGVISASTTSSTQAGKHRDAALEDGRVVKPRSELQPDYLMDQTGAIAPKWLARAGQTMNIRNLPPTLGSEVDRVRTFLLEENGYDVMEDVLTPVPEEPPASLEFLVARREEGF